MHARFGTIAVLSTLALALAAAPVAAQAKKAKPSICKDGTTSATSDTGACSSHGGIDLVATAASQKSAKAAKATTRAKKAAASKDTAKAKVAETRAKSAEIGRASCRERV